MKTFVAIATASCMLMATSVPVMAAPAPQPAVAAQDAPTTGVRAKLVERAAYTPRQKSKKFLDTDTIIVGIGALFAISMGICAAAGGCYSSHPASS
ncbi:hypothetical protein EWE75_10835 [Sphingomonas populi]|uniref:Uncharacterized protein n=1 Tax=Sphingomonas populi TaxID=2484750 RepID=A0A4Q6XVP8_9SPHN|nr:hypothetical protein [Sphingomonas populi]RZF64440.1 hypothetical protein EWE75_10835 [Sphingomonas populi]